MRITPAQQRLIAAARRRRLMEYEREYAAWRIQNGLPPARNHFTDEIDCKPANRRQVAMMVIGMVCICIALVVGVYLLALLLGRAL